jgi:hypothetical protein
VSVNKFFHDSNKTSIATERSLYSNLVKEAIQIFGHNVFYVNRSFVKEDSLFGEDTLSKFTDSQQVEMYVENAEGGLEGEKELVSKFGLDIKDEVTFVVNKERFQDLTKQIAIESGTDSEAGGSILLEDGTVDSKLETGSSYIVSEDTVTDADRPLEGDLVYHPIIGKLFEISFVDHDEPFFQLDNNPVFKLKCRTMEYGSEDINTGIDTLDSIETDSSLDTLRFQFTLEQTSSYTEEIALEDGNLLLEETDGDNIISETQYGGASLLLESSDTYYVRINNKTNTLVDEEIIIGATSGAIARVKYVSDEQIGFEYISHISFQNDEIIRGQTSSASATISELEEENHYLINEDFKIDTIDEQAQNELFENLDDTILDFSESNPFGDAGRFL